MGAHELAEVLMAIMGFHFRRSFPSQLVGNFFLVLHWRADVGEVQERKIASQS